MRQVQCHSLKAKLCSLLYRRFRHFNGDKTKGLIFLCCELIENNGSALREYVLRHAAATHLEPEFSEWIKDSCIFCNTLVDRIVSGFPHDTIDEVRDELGFDDRLVNHKPQFRRQNIAFITFKINSRRKCVGHTFYKTFFRFGPT